MTLVYWTIKERGAGFYLIKYWTKLDKSDAREFRSVTTEEAKMKVRIERDTGMKKIKLQFQR